MRGQPMGRTGQRVNLFDGEALFERQRGGGGNNLYTDAIRDEIRRIVGADDLFAEDTVGKGRESCKKSRVGFAGWDDLDEPHVTRRIEKMRPEESFPCFGREYFGDRRNRQAGGVRRQQRVGARDAAQRAEAARA